ncbi:ER membrane protein complex subunit 7-like [Mizuhopecten yessoensis]|uniref:ER membrane protein complex subunit 7-like n=1 Tax=Mizuhopecten yessoensis TaxID=6573 RepID=UPI000B45BB42|nr:ER membrane protein complex subunit 7-like [Mizuhopecten yessoensis]
MIKMNFQWNYFVLYVVFVGICLICSVLCDESVDSDNNGHFKIDGKVDLVAYRDKDWMMQTRVLVDGGDYVGLLRSDGSFTINGVPSGSYVIEVSHPNFIFDAARVDITSKGKMRARKVNYLQPSIVKNIQYPLEIKERMKANYFQTREQWRFQDFLMNPMVLTMVLPLFLIMVLPKMMNAADPGAQKEMQSQMKALNDKSAMPDISEMLAGWLGGGDSKKASKTKAVKRRS